MALIQCKDCGSQVSDRAGKCPKCGLDIDAGSGFRSTLKVIMFSITALAFVAGCVKGNVVTGLSLSLFPLMLFLALFVRRVA